MNCPDLHELPPAPPGKTGWPWTEECPPLSPRRDGSAYPRISVVTPSYNQAEYLEETIRSVLLQGYPNLEYFVIDGKSSDNSVEVIRKYAAWLTRWTSEPDGGQSEAINKGLGFCNGEILAWINSDDLYCPDALKKAAETFAGNAGLGLVHGDCICVDASGAELGVLRGGPVILRRLLTGRNTLLQPSTFFKRGVLERAGGLDPELHYVMDYDLWVRMMVAGCASHYIPVSLARYRLHSNAKTVKEEFLMKLEAKQVIDHVYSRQGLPKEFRKWKQAAYSNYHWSIGESYLKDGQTRAARQEFWQAIRLKPLRPATVIVLAFLLDAWLGTRLGSRLQHLRWRLPDSSRSNILWDELMKGSSH